MTSVTKVKSDDLARAMGDYVHRSLKDAGLDDAKALRPEDAARLPKDLRDNVAKSRFASRAGTVKREDFVRELEVESSAWANAADRNRDGFVSNSERCFLPPHLRDNFDNYVKALGRQVRPSGGLWTRDTTPPARIAEHVRKFGRTAIGYDEAFKRALNAAAKHDEGLRMFVTESGGPDGEPVTSAAKVDAIVKKLLAEGSMELLSPSSDIPTGEDHLSNWIFSVNTEGVGDHGVWAIVDRNSGQASVSSFN